MLRPCFLVVDREFPGSISSRKLVLETAKYNVITAYSSAEALETLRRFPGVDGVVLNAHIDDMPCEELAAQLKAMEPNLPIVVTSSGGDAHCAAASHHVRSFDPKLLLETLRQICGAVAGKLAEHEKVIEESLDK